MSIERLPAIKARICDITNGRYFPGNKEEMRPGYIITPFGEKISRVNIVASVIEKFVSEEGNYSTITIDDSTNAIRVKAFKESTNLLNGSELGDMVRAIGKLKEYNGEVYVNAEVVRKMENPNHEILNKLEILKRVFQQKKIVDEIKNIVDEMPEEDIKVYVKEKYDMDEEKLRTIIDSKKTEIDYKPKILEVVKSLENENGVEIGKIFELSNLPENIIENALNDLLAQGLIFEPSPGKLKRV